MKDTIRRTLDDRFLQLLALSCSSKNQVPYFILNKVCDQLKLNKYATHGKKKKNKKKTKKKHPQLSQVFQLVTSLRQKFCFVSLIIVFNQVVNAFIILLFALIKDWWS